MNEYPHKRLNHTLSRPQAGSEAFKSITQIYYRGASCAILVYDITNRRTFLSLNSWLEDLDERCDNSKVIKMLVANKRFVSVPTTNAGNSNIAIKSDPFKVVMKVSSAGTLQ